MPTAAIIGGIAAAGSVGSAVIGSNAASKASAAQVAADQAALSTQVSSENVANQQLAPFVDIGTGAAHSLANLYGISYAGQGTGAATTGPNGVVTPANSNAPISSAGGSAVQQQAQLGFTNSPDYNFAFTQGLQALQRSAAAGGTLQSGGQTKAALEFGQGLASQQYGNYFNRLLSLSNMGQSTASGVASNSIGAGNSQAQTQQGIGTATASGIVGAGNQLGAGLTGIGSAATNSLLLSKLGGSSPSAYSSPSLASLPGQSNASGSIFPDWSQMNIAA